MKAYYSMGLCGYEVSVNDDCESVTYRFVGTEKEHPYQHAKVYWPKTKDRPYFLANGRRIHLDECMRVL